MVTAARPVRDAEELHNPNVVKVTATAQASRCISRAPVPHGREESVLALARVHIGLYVYRRATLLRLAGLPPGRLEQIEGLEQLRALENGIRIRVIDTDFQSAEVNTPEDLARA